MDDRRFAPPRGAPTTTSERSGSVSARLAAGFSTTGTVAESPPRPFSPSSIADTRLGRSSGLFLCARAAAGVGRGASGGADGADGAAVGGNANPGGAPIADTAVADGAASIGAVTGGRTGAGRLSPTRGAPGRSTVSSAARGPTPSIGRSGRSAGRRSNSSRDWSRSTVGRARRRIGCFGSGKTMPRSGRCGSCCEVRKSRSRAGMPYGR